MNTDQIQIQIKRIGTNTDLPLPTYHSESAVGLDLAAAVDGTVVLAPGKRTQIPCGFALAIPVGYEGQVRPRSGIATQFGLTIINSPGTIDPDFRGEIKISVINHGSEDVAIRRGMRIAQLIIAPLPRVVWAECTELPETARGEAGFGHTGS